MRFQRANQVQDGVTILGNDDDGFIHIQVALNALRATDNSTHDGCGTGVSQHFDRIVFADISGMGFTLVLDDFKLISPNVMKASDFFLPTLSTLPPVFGDDLLSLKSARNRYTIKLKPNVTHDAISMICQELGGAALHPRRFSGMCNTPLKLVSLWVAPLWLGPAPLAMHCQDFAVYARCTAMLKPKAIAIAEVFSTFHQTCCSAARPSVVHGCCASKHWQSQPVRTADNTCCKMQPTQHAL